MMLPCCHVLDQTPAAGPQGTYPLDTLRLRVAANSRATVLLHLQYTVNAARHRSKGGRSCRSWAESWLLGHRAHTRWTR